jgi:hypothetical protein
MIKVLGSKPYPLCFRFRAWPRGEVEPRPAISERAVRKEEPGQTAPATPFLSITRGLFPDCGPFDQGNNLIKGNAPPGLRQKTTLVREFDLRTL